MSARIIALPTVVASGNDTAHPTTPGACDASPTVAGTGIPHPLTVRAQALELLDTIDAIAYGVLVQTGGITASVRDGVPMTASETDRLLSRVDRLRDAVEGCKVLVSTTLRTRT